MNSITGIGAAELSAESLQDYYESHVSENTQGYYGVLKSVANKFAGKLNGNGVFTKDGAKKLYSNENFYNAFTDEVANLFSGDSLKKEQFKKMASNHYRESRTVKGMEGIAGGSAIFSSSQGAIPSSIMPFVIGGFIATSASQECYNIIAYQNPRLNFEYNIKYMYMNGEKFYYPKSFRKGEIEGFNELPEIKWSNKWVAGDANRPAWASITGDTKDMILVDSESGSMVTGNFFEAGKIGKTKSSLDFGASISKVVYEVHQGTDNAGTVTWAPLSIDGKTEFTKRINVKADVATGQPQKRLYKAELTIGHEDPAITGLDSVGNKVKTKFILVSEVDHDSSDFVIAARNVEQLTPGLYKIVIKAFKFNAKLVNIQNEDIVPEMGVEKFQFIREATYKQYVKASMNEYMQDNFDLGDNSISYPAYAIDNLLEATLFNREMLAERHFMTDIDETDDLDVFPLTKKMGGFIQNGLQFDIGKMAMGLQPQDYKDGLKDYLSSTLAISETYIHMNKDIKKEWILFGYDAVVAKFPNIKFEDAVVNNSDSPVGGAANQNFGFQVSSRCGYSDSYGRSVRIIGNTDERWLDRRSSVYGVLKTNTMAYPFMVYYPYSVRMQTVIDPEHDHRTAIVLGGREFRDTFAMGGIKLNLNGAIDSQGMPINNFERQISDSKTLVANSTSTTPTQVVIKNTAEDPVIMNDATV